MGEFVGSTILLAVNVLNYLIPLLLIVSTFDLVRTFWKIKKSTNTFWKKMFQFVKRLGIWLLILAVLFNMVYAIEAMFFTSIDKPVIYLYPETRTDVHVKLDYQGELIADYPVYDTSIGGWSVTAEPNGKLTNHADGKEYSYIFWEGKSSEQIEWDLSTGFVVPGDETRDFLQKVLADIGLTPKEYNEFIVYWYPKMKDNDYNLIHFAEEQYTDSAPLTISPKPDSMLRVFMVYKPIKKPIEIEPQIFSSFERNGFTVVEWGGAEIK